MKEDLNWSYNGGGDAYLLQSVAIHFNHTVHTIEWDRRWYIGMDPVQNNISAGCSTSLSAIIIGSINYQTIIIIPYHRCIKSVIFSIMIINSVIKNTTVIHLNQTIGDTSEILSKHNVSIKHKSLYCLFSWYLTSHWISMVVGWCRCFSHR